MQVTLFHAMIYGISSEHRQFKQALAKVYYYYYYYFPYMEFQEKTEYSVVTLLDIVILSK